MSLIEEEINAYVKDGLFLYDEKLNLYKAMCGDGVKFFEWLPQEEGKIVYKFKDYPEAFEAFLSNSFKVELYDKGEL